MTQESIDQQIIFFRQEFFVQRTAFTYTKYVYFIALKSNLAESPSVNHPASNVCRGINSNSLFPSKTISRYFQKPMARLQYINQQT